MALTANYNSLIKSIFNMWMTYPSSPSGQSETPKGYLPVTNIWGSTFYLSLANKPLNAPWTQAYRSILLCPIIGGWHSSGDYYVAPYQNNYIGVWVVIGSGTHDPNDSIYNLASPINTSDLTIYYGLPIGQSATGDPITQLHTTYRFQITNNKSESLTISEVGIVGEFAVSGANGQGGDANEMQQCLLDYTLLSTPIEIPVSGTGILEYTLTTDLTSN